METTTTGLGISISFSARWWSFISNTRIFVSAFCAHTSGDPDFSDKVAMTIHELLENAVKYSADPDQSVQCVLSLDGDKLRIRVENTVSDIQRRTFNEEFAVITEGDPLDVYITQMQACVSHEKSQLGLARIRYEAEAGLKMSTSDNMAIVEAEFVLPDGKVE